MIILFYIDILLVVAFFTLFERKVMASFHIRKGPNKTSFLGILQPLLDALKLLTKQKGSLTRGNSSVFNLSPLLVLSLSLFMWNFLPLSINYTNYSMSLIWYIVFASVMVFFNMMSGWSSNSKYSLMGTLRSAATSISYESTFMFCILFGSLSYFTLNISSFYNIKDNLILFVLPIMLISLLAELHRTPFDFSESESELVSGYNTEYGGKNFAFLFLGEYSMLMFNSILLEILFVQLDTILLACCVVVCISIVFINIRVTLCRHRYDLLMMFNWKLLLPITMLLVLGLSFL